MSHVPCLLLKIPLYIKCENLGIHTQIIEPRICPEKFFITDDENDGAITGQSAVKRAPRADCRQHSCLLMNLRNDIPQILVILGNIV